MTEIDDGRRVDEMIAEGLRIAREAIEAYRPAAVVAAYSGGDDSVVSTHFTIANIPGALVFNADTLIGLAPARAHIAATAARYGWPLEVGRATAEGPPKKTRRAGKMVPFDPSILAAGEWREGATAYEEYCLNFGFPGRGKPQHARMYQRLKERPFRRLLRRFGATRAEGRPKVLIVSGIRGDESAIRAGYKRAVSEGFFGDIWINPFYWRTAADFAAYRDEFGLPCNPVKRRCGISGECCCGTFANHADGERPAYREADPAFADYLDGLEARVKEVFPWGWGQSPPAWWADRRRGQQFMFDGLFGEAPAFQPMCVGCNSGRR